MNQGWAGTSIPCPHCGVSPVETAVKLGFLRGFLIFCRFGSEIVFGCRPCVNRRVRSSAAINLAMGWWCFPWGIATPFVVLQNLSQLFVRPPGRLPSLIGETGTAAPSAPSRGAPARGTPPRADDADEMRRQLVLSICACVARLEEAGQRAATRATAATFVNAVTGGELSEGQVLALINECRSAPVALAGETADRRLLALEAVVLIAITAGPLTAPVLTKLREITAELGLAQSALEDFLAHHSSDIGNDDGAPSDWDIENAATVLGITADAPLSTARENWRALLLRWHPDHAVANGVGVEEATRRTREINDAYRVFVDAAAESAA